MKDPSEVVAEGWDGSVVVRKIRDEVERRVAWTWRVVCGVKGSGKDRCLGWRLGSMDVRPGAAASSPCWSGMAVAGVWDGELGLVGVC